MSQYTQCTANLPLHSSEVSSAVVVDDDNGFITSFRHRHVFRSFSTSFPPAIFFPAAFGFVYQISCVGSEQYYTHTRSPAVQMPWTPLETSVASQKSMSKLIYIAQFHAKHLNCAQCTSISRTVYGLSLSSSDTDGP